MKHFHNLQKLTHTTQNWEGEVVMVEKKDLAHGAKRGRSKQFPCFQTPDHLLDSSKTGTFFPSPFYRLTPAASASSEREGRSWFEVFQPYRWQKAPEKLSQTCRSHVFAPGKSQLSKPSAGCRLTRKQDQNLAFAVSVSCRTQRSSN